MTLGTWTDGGSTSDSGTWEPCGAERTIDMGNMYAGKDFWCVVHAQFCCGVDEQHI